MMIGVDSSVIVAGIHANHPRHTAAAHWLVRALTAHELVICHHSILEAYAVLTSLPGSFRVTPSEARDLLTATVKGNMAVAGFEPASTWEIIGSFIPWSVAGSRSYDAFVARVLHAHGARAVATFNVKHFAGLIEGFSAIDPGETGAT
jgi:predicted nucleic acid-binding protein